MGVLYILDEPSIGLHSGQRQAAATLKRLRVLGNTLLGGTRRGHHARGGLLIYVGPGAGFMAARSVAAGTGEVGHPQPHGPYLYPASGNAAPRFEDGSWNFLKVIGAFGEQSEKRGREIRWDLYLRHGVFRFRKILSSKRDPL